MLKLIRSESSPEGTFGTLALPDGTVFHTLELPWRNNAIGKSCIPVGTYDMRFVKSPRFGRELYRLDDRQTSPRSAILIHVGNWAGDVGSGWFSNVDGCILLGKGRHNALAPSGRKPQRAVTQSALALDMFHAWAQGRELTLTIAETYCSGLC